MQVLGDDTRVVTKAYAPHMVFVYRTGEKYRCSDFDFKNDTDGPGFYILRTPEIAAEYARAYFRFYEFVPSVFQLYQYHGIMHLVDPEASDDVDEYERLIRKWKSWWYVHTVLPRQS
jgi:hypothetical protein